MPSSTASTRVEAAATIRSAARLSARVTLDLKCIVLRRRCPVDWEVRASCRQREAFALKITEYLRVTPR
jgi:hypothetical protein